MLHQYREVYCLQCQQGQAGQLGALTRGHSVEPLAAYGSVPCRSAGAHTGHTRSPCCQFATQQAAKLAIAVGTVQ